MSGHAFLAGFFDRPVAGGGWRWLAVVEVPVEGCSADADDVGNGFYGVLSAHVHL